MTQSTAVTADALRQEILKDENTLRTLMTMASECYLELASGSGRGADIYAEYRESNLSTGKPVADLAESIVGQALAIASRATALDAKRAQLLLLETAERCPEESGSH